MWMAVFIHESAATHIEEHAKKNFKNPEMEKIVADIAVIHALSASDTVQSLTEGRIFNTIRPELDEKEDKIPYVVVTYEGMTNDCDNKDMVEGASDNERVQVLCVACDRIQLANLINAARDAIREYLSEHDSLIEFGIADYELSASAILSDWTVPCTYQSLNYSISTII